MFRRLKASLTFREESILYSDLICGAEGWYSNSREAGFTDISKLYLWLMNSWKDVAAWLENGYICALSRWLFSTYNQYTQLQGREFDHYFTATSTHAAKHVLEYWYASFDEAYGVYLHILCGNSEATGLACSRVQTTGTIAARATTETRVDPGPSMTYGINCGDRQWHDVA